MTPPPTNADLAEIAADPYEIGGVRQIATELLRKRRELRIATRIIVDRGHWPEYEQRVRAARRGSR